MFGILAKPSLLKPMKVKVEQNGEYVELTIGNSTMRMSYEHALTLSQWLRLHGKAAKRFAGDGSRHWSMVAMANGAPEVK